MEIDDLIYSIREIISDVAIETEQDSELYPIVSVDNSADYNSVIDSLYMLEDTQLAKHAFLIRCESLSIGELYLYFYGVFNAVYMQQQALLVILRKMGIEFNPKALRDCKIFDLRNTFAAHGANRGGRDVKAHSFILDRHALQTGKVSGYSANHENGFISHDYHISDLISDWDATLLAHIELIHDMVRENSELTI
ncbi:hypothetical protein NB463_12985 [Vibrio sp. RM-41-2B]|uniref:hypothetical protein n=1 Tax=unclassified Vibrio TaxID=2614977 RepID=UPI00215C05A4|nr:MULTISPECIES: hypothetical protein [unclassified Vibrio]MCR9552238.1 hypothetical protein [Vibrio sp. RM-41-2A]MCR9557002.1 hypothetical protein [Vibrio sp. RM-41-2B]